MQRYWCPLGPLIHLFSSKTIYIIAKVGKILNYIVIPIVAIIMCFILYFTINITVQDNTISFRTFGNRKFGVY